MFFHPVLLEAHKSAIRAVEVGGLGNHTYTYNHNHNHTASGADIEAGLYWIPVFVFFTMIITCALFSLSISRRRESDDDVGEHVLSSTPLRPSQVTKNYFTAPVAEPSNGDCVTGGSVSARARPLSGTGRVSSFPVPVACAFNGMSPTGSRLPHAAPVALGVRGNGSVGHSRREWSVRRESYPEF